MPHLWKWLPSCTLPLSSHPFYHFLFQGRWWGLTEKGCPSCPSQITAKHLISIPNLYLCCSALLFCIITDQSMKGRRKVGVKQGVTKKPGLKGVQILKRNEDLNLLTKVRGKLPRCILWTEERRQGDMVGQWGRTEKHSKKEVAKEYEG